MMTELRLMPMVTAVIIVTRHKVRGLRLFYILVFLWVKICLRFTVVVFYYKCNVIVD